MDKRPSLVFIASRFPYPLEKGDKLRAYNLLKGLSKTHNIHLIALSNEDVKASWYDEVRPFTTAITVYTMKPIWQWIRLIICAFTNQPFQLAYFTSFKIKRRIRKQIVSLAPDHIFCQMIRPAEYVKDYHHCNKTIDYMDTLSVGMERRAQKAPWVTRWIYKMEAIRLKEYEQRIFNYFEFQTMISQQDVHYIAHPDQRKIRVIPNGIDTDFFQPLPSTSKPFELVFVGNLSYAPNVDAMRWFAENVVIHEPQWRLLIAGANPSHTLIQSLKKYPNITIEGWQPDIRLAYSRGKVFIAPMQIGTGMQNKLLEAMAMGIPCITTPLASEALTVIPGKDLLVGSTNEAILTHIRYLLDNPKEAETIGTQGRKTVHERYSWEQSIEGLNELLIPQR
ncbi:MAG: glycosyltransferase [Flavobacteriales bacterium]